MFDRAKIAQGARASVVRACWPLSIVRTVLICAALLTMCCVTERQSDSSQTVTYGKGCVSKDFFSIQNSISTLQTLMQVLGVATRFARMAHSTETRSRYVIVARFSGVLIGMSVYCLCGSNCVPLWILIMARFSGLLIGMSVYCLCGSDCVPHWILIMARFSDCVPHWILIMARFSDCVPHWILIMARFSDCVPH